MKWVATPKKDTANESLEKRLWASADQFRANSDLKAQEYSGPILGIIFLRFAEVRFKALRAKLERAASSSRRGSRVDEPSAYAAEGTLYRADKVLFIDARHIYRQIDRAHREWTPGQIGFIANLVRLYRGEELDYTAGGNEAEAKVIEIFGKKPKYSDVLGLCAVADIGKIESQGWSLNPGRYIGVAPGEEVSNEDFKEQFLKLNEELETLNAQARELEATIARNAAEILDT